MMFSVVSVLDKSQKLFTTMIIVKKLVYDQKKRIKNIESKFETNIKKFESKAKILDFEK